MKKLIRFKVTNKGKYWAVIDTMNDDQQVGFDKQYSGAKALARKLERESIEDISDEVNSIVDSYMY